MKTNRGIYECMKCPHTGNKGNMLEHFIRHHVTTDRAPWSCSLCGYRAISRSALVNHGRLYMHLTAAKNNPGAPTNFVKSSNPYIVREGEDMRLLNCADWEQNGDSNNEGFSPDKKRRMNEQTSDRKKMRRTAQSGSGRNRPSRFRDYEVHERPDMPEYDLQDDMDLAVGNYHHSGSYPVYEPSYLSVGDRNLIPSRRAVNMSRRLHDPGNQNDMYGSYSDETNEQTGQEQFEADGFDFQNGVTWFEGSSEPVSGPYALYPEGGLSVEGLPRQMITDGVENRYGDGESSTSLLRRPVPAEFTQFNNRGMPFDSGQQMNLMDYRSQADGQSVHSRSYTNSKIHAYNGDHMQNKDVSTAKIPCLLSLNLERAAASSSSVERSSGDVNESTIEERNICNPIRSTSETARRQTEYRETAITSAGSGGEVGQSSKNADQSAEVGSSCSTDKGTGGQEVDALPESEVKRPCHESMGKEAVGAESSRSGGGQESERERETPKFHEENCPDDESQEDDDIGENQLLEEKMTDLINALEPLKNISKALIALDHHMRRLLPMVENFTKGMASPKSKTRKQ